ncbi:MAG: MTAP family purine nucleoside phosphorylase [Armatimonadetes bacterium]|nr:MTAP family purine nucleoside phosphorylase [Armatimonadota bacterium]
MNLAIIGGTGIDEMPEFTSGSSTLVSTRFGDARVIECDTEIGRLLFLPRHGGDHSVPPSLVNYRSNIAALKKLGAERVIGVCAVGSLRTELGAGSFVVFGDFIDQTKRRIDTFFDQPGEPVAHTDLTNPYCPEVSGALAQACIDEKVPFEPDAVYVGVEGPRYESPAEIRLYASWGGDVIGMTNLPEVVLAREAGLCYGALGIVTNLASGLCPTPLAHDEVRAAMISTGLSLRSILRRASKAMPKTRGCACSSNTALRV